VLPQQGLTMPQSVAASLQAADHLPPFSSFRWPSRVEQGQIAPLDA
jgi:hypothetical protein